MEYKKNQILDVEITDMSENGEGIGKVSGYTLFVKDAVIGDVVRARLTKVKKNYSYARLEEIVVPSQYRVEAPCPISRQCGGCQIQALDYAGQLRFKEEKVINDLVRIGGFERDFVESIAEPVIGMENPYRYRNKAQYPVGCRLGYDKSDYVENKAVDGAGKGDKKQDRTGNRQKKQDSSGNRIITGFYAGRTHSIIENDDCLIGCEENKEILNKVIVCMNREGISAYDETTGKGTVRHILIRKGFVTGEIMVCLVVNLRDEEYKSLTGKFGLMAMAEKPGAADGNSDKYSDQPFDIQCTNSADDLDGLDKSNNKYISENNNINNSKDRKKQDREKESNIISKFEKIITELHKIPGMTSISLNINNKNTNVIMGEKCVTLWGEDAISDYIGDVKFRISPLSFFQVNPVQTKKLYEKALEYADLKGDETVWDLYCGIGTVSLFLARRAKKVYGVEIVEQAILDARENARINGIENVEFITGAAESIIINERPDIVVVDPPRKGCDKALLDTILKVRPSKIVYVSCNPSTLSRDLNYLTANATAPVIPNNQNTIESTGLYKLERFCPVDQFPHTIHVETVVLLSQQNRMIM